MPFSIFKKNRYPTQAAASAPPSNAATPTPPPVVTPPRPNDRPQLLGNALDLTHLGSKVGKVDISCKLEGISSQYWGPKWCISNATIPTTVQGALYFELQISRPRDVPLEFAKIRLKFGNPPNAIPSPFIEAHAPNRTFSGPPMLRTTGKNQTARAEAGLNTPFGGGNLNLGERGKSDESNPARSWAFSSHLPNPTDSSTDPLEVEFTYTHGWEDDYDGLNRKFRTAVIVNRELVENLAMSVQVEAKPLNSWHHTGPPLERTSGLLQPRHNTEAVEFAALLSTLEENIANANRELSSTVLGPRATVDQAGPSTAQQIEGMPNVGLLPAPGMATSQAIQGSALLFLPSASIPAQGQPQGQILAPPIQAGSSTTVP